MPGKLPKDCSARAIGTRARSLVVYKLNSEKWEWHEQTGTDHGTDIGIELVENEEFVNKKIEGQIKGTKCLKKLLNGDITFNMEIKTVKYALNSIHTFVLFLADVSNETVYYLPLQDYFIDNPDKLDIIEKNNKTVTVHIGCKNILNDKADELCMLAKNIYSGYSGGKLARIR